MPPPITISIRSETCPSATGPAAQPTNFWAAGPVAEGQVSERMLMVIGGGI